MDEDTKRARQLVVALTDYEWQTLFPADVVTEQQKTERATTVLSMGLQAERRERNDTIRDALGVQECNVRWVIYVSSPLGILGHLLGEGDYVKYGDETISIVDGDPEAKTGLTLISYPRESVLGVENHQALVHGKIPR